MRKQSFVLIFFAFFAFDFSVHLLATTANTMNVQNGILDLRNIEVNEEKVIHLIGMWKFYWKRLITGATNVSSDEEQINDTAYVPASWTKKTLKDGTRLPGFGYATYHLKILGGDRLTNLNPAFRFPKTLYATHIYFKKSPQDKPQLVAKRGVPGTSQESFLSNSRPIIIHLQLGAESDIYIQTSNFLDPNQSGITKYPQFGSLNAILKWDKNRRQADFLIIGAIAAVGFLMIILYVIWPSEKAPFWLALFCFLIAVRVGSLNRYFSELLPDIFWEHWFHRMNYFTIILSIPSYLLFLVKLFPNAFKTRLSFTMVGIFVIYSSTILVLPIPVFSRTQRLFMVFTLVFFIIILYYYLSSLLRDRDGFLFLAFLGTIFVFISGSLEIVSRMWLYSEYDFVPLGLLLNILCMGFIVALSNSKARQKSVQLAVTLTDEVTQRRKAEEEVNEINRKLEILVEERTQDLKKVYDELVANAHKAGMAEIASNTLHNVGNVLNSLTTSAMMIDRSIGESPLTDYMKANQILKENLDNFVSFLNTNPNGMKLLEYYLRLEKAFTSTFDTIHENSARLQKKAEVISQIITAQQSLAGSVSLVEAMNVVEVVEDALNILPSSSTKANIDVNKKIGSVPQVKVQRSKLIHVLINLFMNALNAMQHVAADSKKLTIEVESDENTVWINITDNGCGIPEENLDKIFLHGFTTRKDGNGFGLHSSAIYMQEMNGSISAQSEGEGKGTVFTLTFPTIQTTLIN
jgi:signal transduction histidine kinase